MNLSRYATESQAVLTAAQALTREKEHRAVEPEHLLSALMDTRIMDALLKKLSVNPQNIQSRLEIELAKYPRAVQADTHFSPQFVKVTSAAEVLATKKGEKEVSLLGLIRVCFVLASIAFSFERAIPPPLAPCNDYGLATLRCRSN